MHLKCDIGIFGVLNIEIDSIMVLLADKTV